MLGDLDKVIRGMIDIDLFNREGAAEQQESPFLVTAREKIAEVLKGLVEE